MTASDCGVLKVYELVIQQLAWQHWSADQNLEQVAVETLLKECFVRPSCLGLVALEDQIMRLYGYRTR